MRRWLALLFGLGCALALLLSCFSPVLFRDKQFGYRDAAHFYYPLYLRVQQEWSKGRLPLWDARENAGMPLLGNPTAAVLYPGKLIYATLPYAWAARIYPIAHVVLACLGMYILMRSWQVGAAGAAFAALAYGFGAPVIFQYCNIIFLVGAAWVPFGLWAIDGWVRTGRRSSIAVLSLVLAMQTLGGDPESAYVMGLCGGGYALGLTIARRRQAKGVWPVRGVTLALATLAVLILWTSAVFAAALYFPGTRAKGPPVGPISWSKWFPAAVNAAWLLIAVSWLGKQSARRGPLAAMLFGLGSAAVLAGTLAAAQLLPVTEFTNQTMRVALDGPHDVYQFSVEPYRVVEMIWPQPFASNRVANRGWGTMVPPRHKMFEWVPSLYIGGLTLVLSLSVLGLRGRGARRVWLSWIAVVSLAAAIGEYAGPLWIGRCIPSVAAALGEHETQITGAIRADGKLRDGDGSVYNLMTLLLPGFSSFRYPGKLLTFTCVALAGLAGMGLDRAISVGSRRPMTIAFVFAILSGGLLTFALYDRSGIIAWFRRNAGLKGASVFGPFDEEGAWTESVAALLQGVIVFWAAVAILGAAKRWSWITASGALLLLAVDLGFASAPLILTVPQADFEAMPELVTKIAEAEAADPSPGPFRIHRMPSWDPVGFYDTRSPDRYRELMNWELRTIQPKYAIPYGLSYTQTEGVAEVYDYSWFFAPFPVDRNYQGGTRDNKDDKQVIYFPRRAYDLWATRYFIVPTIAANDERRACYSFLYDAEPIYPTNAQTIGPGSAKFLDKWGKQEDWRLLKNKNAFPRAWVVHSADIRQPIEGFSQESRQARRLLMESIVYAGDLYWNSQSRRVADLRSRAFVETDDRDTLMKGLSFEAQDESETVEFKVADDDQRVVLEANLKSPGLVVLADLNYPGWELHIDGKKSPIYRANRMMRGALVPAGRHRLVYVYNPRSTRLGAAVSAFGIMLTVGYLLWCRKHRRSERLDLL